MEYEIVGAHLTILLGDRNGPPGDSRPVDGHARVVFFFMNDGSLIFDIRFSGVILMTFIVKLSS